MTLLHDSQFRVDDAEFLEPMGPKSLAKGFEFFSNLSKNSECVI